MPGDAGDVGFGLPIGFKAAQMGHFSDGGPLGSAAQDATGPLT